MSESPNRRVFLATAGVTVASVVTPRLFAQPKDSPVQGTRESVAGMDTDHPTLVSYRTAIEAMKKLDKDDPTNPLGWRYQANMHGALKADGEKNGWKWCMHGNWWFLPWHRGYVYFFEKIVRKMSGSEAFRLPYWSWEKDGQNVLPAPFRDAKYMDKDNPLFDDSRVEANKGGPLRPNTQSGSFAFDWGIALAIEQFTTTVPELAYGGLRTPKTMLPAKPMPAGQHGGMEHNAHDMLHDAVGGDAGVMGDTRTAARDPIFWLHHANVDRLWNRWLDIKEHHLPDPTDDKDWYDQEFPYFDETGEQVVLSVSKILELAAKESRYDDDRRLVAAAPPAAREKAVEPKVVSVGAIQPMLALGTKTFSKPIGITEDTKPKLMAALAAPRAGAEAPVVLLRVEGIKPPKDARLTFEVFVTKKGEKPSKKSYVGPISFFGRRGDHEHVDDEGFTQGFDVTNQVQKLRTANKGVLPELEVFVVPHSTAGLSDEELAKKDVVIPISNITLKLVTVEKK
ncbi:MAG: tyrosinase [Gemmataceae bacterium]|nr:tyrosinase [Gemmataceae bacterium]